MEDNLLSLPDKLVERILVSAWCTLTPPESKDEPRAFAFGEACEGYRWIFLRTISLLCSQWRRIILGVALRNIVIRTQADSNLMRVIAHAALRDIGLQDSAHAEWNQAYRRLFRHSIMTIDAADYRRFEHKDYTKTIIRLCPSEEASTILPSVADANTVILRNGLVSDMATWLGQCLHIHTVLDLDYQPWRDECLTLPREVQRFSVFLRHRGRLIDRYGFSVYQRVPAKVVEICVRFQHALVYKFPPDAHWLQKLHVLYLNTPPVGIGTSYIQPWCIKTSLKSGLLAQRSSIGTFTIRILGGRTVEEKGWQNALSACLANGVLLEYYNVYEDGQGDSAEHMFAGEHRPDSYGAFACGGL
jgi:hypothetical protein